MNIHSVSSTVVDEMHEDEVHRGCAYISIFHVIFVESVGVVGVLRVSSVTQKGFGRKVSFKGSKNQGRRNILLRIPTFSCRTVMRRDYAWCAFYSSTVQP